MILKIATHNNARAAGQRACKEGVTNPVEWRVRFIKNMGFGGLGWIGSLTLTFFSTNLHEWTRMNGRWCPLGTGKAWKDGEILGVARFGVTEISEIILDLKGVFENTEDRERARENVRNFWCGSSPFRVGPAGGSLNAHARLYLSKSMI